MNKSISYLRKIVNATANLLTANALPLLLMVLFSIILGRKVGPAIFGEFSITMIIGTIFRTLVDAGYNIDIPRQVAKDKSGIAENKSGIAEIISRSQALKNNLWLAFVPVIIILGMAVASSQNYLLIIIWTLPYSISSTYKSVLRGMMEMKILARIEVTIQSILFLILIILVYFYDGLWLFFSIFIIFQLVEAGVYHRKLGKMGIDSPKFISMFIPGFTAIRYAEYKSQFKLAGVIFLSILQYRMPTLVMGTMSMPAGLGYYTAAMRFLTLLRVIPGTLLNTLLPDISEKMAGKEKYAMMPIILLSLFIGMAIGGGLYLLSSPLIHLTFDFDEAVPVLQILSLSFIFVMVNMTLESFLLAWKREVYVSGSLIASGIFVLIIALILIADYGASGAAWAVICGEFILFLLYTFGIIYFRRRIFVEELIID